MEIERECPFCGGSDLKVVWWGLQDVCAVECDDERCGAVGPTATTEDGAIKKWNGDMEGRPMAEYVD